MKGKWKKPAAWVAVSGLLCGALGGCAPEAAQQSTQQLTQQPTQESTQQPAAQNVKKLKLSASAPYGIYTANQNITFVLKADRPADGELTVEIVLKNSLNSETVKGEVTLHAGEDSATADLGKAALGHYEVKAEASCGETELKTRYVGVTHELSERSGTDERFSVDLASTWHANSRQRKQYAELIKLMGVSNVRERIRLGDIYDEATGKVSLSKYLPALQTLQEFGLDTIITFHDYPASLSAAQQKVMPADLLKTYRLVKAAADAAGDLVSAWEIWNEQDVIHFGNDYPDEYAAFLKAAAIALSDSQADPIKALGAFARDPYYSKFGVWMLENRVLDYVDVYNYHSYVFSGPSATPSADLAAIGKHMEAAANWGRASLPLWQTETGTIHSEGTVEVRSKDSLMQQARYVALSAVQNAALGIERTYQYLFLPYAGGDDISLLGHNETVYPAYLTYANLTYYLSGAQFLGSMERESCNGYVLSRAGGGEIMMLWSNKATAMQIAVSGNVSLSDAYGSVTALQAENGKVKVQFGSSPVYVITDGSFAKEEYQSMTVSYDPVEKVKFSPVQRIVISPAFPEKNAPVMPTLENVKENFEGVDSGYQFDKGEKATVTVTVYNFNDSAMSGTVRASVPEGFSVDTAPKRVSLEPYGSAVLTFTLAAKDLPEMGSLVFEGEFGGEKTSPAVSKVQIRRQ